MMNKREFLKSTALFASASLLPRSLWSLTPSNQLRTAHIGVGGMGMEDLKAIASHEAVEVKAICDVDANRLRVAQEMYPEAKAYSDYRQLLEEMEQEVDAVIVSTPDHTHAPASLLAMEKNKAVYCQKPLTHHVTEAREMAQQAQLKGLVTQMGIQVHSFYDYQLATALIQSGIIGKVKRVHAWSPKNWGYDGAEPKTEQEIPTHLDWNLWLGTAAKRAYADGFYHPGNWRKLVDYGCGTLGDMGVHIFDTPYNALALDVPKTIKNSCRPPNGFGFPENNIVTYQFPGTKFTTKKFEWIWYDGPGAPKEHKDLLLPDQEALPEQGAMFIGEEGRLLLPHFMQLPRHIVKNKYQDLPLDKFKKMGSPTEDYEKESRKHYHEFVDACLGKGTCSAPFSYASRLTETILLGVIAGRFPDKKLHWNSEKGQFKEEEANQYLSGVYRDF